MKKHIVLMLTAAMLGTMAVPGSVYAADNEIVFWDMVWGNEESIKLGEEICANYSKEHDITVKYQSIPWDNFYQTFLTAIAAGEAPDCSSGSCYMPFQLYDEGAILPIDDLIESMREDGELDDYISQDVVEGYQYDGHYVCLPSGMDMRVLWCRKDVLEENGLEIPTNWEELKSCLEVLSHPEENKYGMIFACNGNNGKVMFEWLINNGGGLFNENGEPDCLSERNIETVNYLLDLINNDLINPASAGLTYDDSKAAFAKGEVAFHYGPPSLVSQLPELADQIALVSPIEGLHGDKGCVYWNGGIMAYNQTKYPEETKDFMRYFVANMKDYCVTGQYSMFPTRNTVLSDPAYADDPVTQQVIDEYFPVMKTIAANSETLFSELSAVESDGTLDAVIQSMFTPGITAEEVLQAEQQNLEMIMG